MDDLWKILGKERKISFCSVPICLRVDYEKASSGSDFLVNGTKMSTYCS